MWDSSLPETSKGRVYSSIDPDLRKQWEDSIAEGGVPSAAMQNAILETMNERGGDGKPPKKNKLSAAEKKATKEKEAADKLNTKEKLAAEKKEALRVARAERAKLAAEKKAANELRVAEEKKAAKVQADIAAEQLKAFQNLTQVVA